MIPLTRRGLLGKSLSVAGAAHIVSPGSALAQTHSAERRPRCNRMRTLEGVSGRHVEVWRIPGRFTKNPDLIRFPSGKMMLVFCDVEKHWTEEISRITTLESSDQGKAWGNPRVIAEADRRKGEERWVTPRLSLLSDGRLAIICDHDDYSHYHEDQPSGIWIWFSSDRGQTWSSPRLTGVPGLEPDRVVELKDGTLLMASCMVFRDTQKEGMFLMRSSDGGATWKDLTVIAKDEINNHTEGALVVLSSGLLACVMRNENQNGHSSFAAFSPDQGRTWSHPRPLPFLGDRPYAKELANGRVLVTYRNRCGNPGTHAWMGDLTRQSGHQIGGMHYGDELRLERDALHIRNRPESFTRYILLPPESYRSDVCMEGSLRVTGPPDQPTAAMAVSRIGAAVEIASNAIWLRNERRPGGRPVIDSRHEADMTSFRTVRLLVRKGLLTVALDGQTVISGVIRDERPLAETWFGRAAEAQGDAWWRSLTYYAGNPSGADHLWTWQAQLGEYPDQYQLDHMLELHANPPMGNHLRSPAGENPILRTGRGRPDNGYSSWTELPDGRIYMVDYTNKGDAPPTAHLYGVYFSPDDFGRSCA